MRPSAHIVADCPVDVGQLFNPPVMQKHNMHEYVLEV